MYFFFLVTSNPCTFTLCSFGSKCVVVDDEAKCLPDPKFRVQCALVTCIPGQKCVVRDGKATFKTACATDTDCVLEGLGTSCYALLGICQ